MYEKYSRARDNDGSMIIERSSEFRSPAVKPELFDSKVFSTPRDLSSEVQSCYSSNPSQPLLCRDKVVLLSHSPDHLQSSKVCEILCFPGGGVQPVCGGLEKPGTEGSLSLQPAKLKLSCQK